MKIIVTGGNGFIGSRLIELLKEAGHEPVAFEGDLLEFETTEKFFLSTQAEALIHLAGVAFGADLNALIDINVKTTNNALLAAVKSGIKRVVFSSSVGVYGNADGGASKESDELKPNSPYGLSKVLSEKVVEYYERNNDLKVTTFRISPVYGPGNTKGVIYNFLKDIKEKGEITVNGNGNQKRNFLHVDDACQALKVAVESSKTGVFNLGSPVSYSINELIDVLKKTQDFKVNYLGSTSDVDLVLDTNKLAEELGFTAKVTDLRVDGLL